MLKWLHHVFNPHCEQCASERECENCKVLRDIIEDERVEKAKLLILIKELTVPAPPIKQEPEEKVELTPRHIPWRIKRELLEAEDRKRAKIQKIEELEQAVGLENADQ